MTSLRIILYTNMNQSQSMMSCDSSATLTGLKTGGIISIKKPKKLTITE